MKPVFHPAVFLGAVILVCAAWLMARPPVAAAPILTRSGTTRPAVVERASIALDAAILERYAGKYEGRGGLTVDLILRDGKLLGRTPVAMPFELLATSQTEFFIKEFGYDVEFDVAGDGTVRGFATNTELGLIEVKRVR
jgi:hypothetical protein